MMRVEMRLTTLYTLMDFKHNHSSVCVPKVRQRVYANFKFVQTGESHGTTALQLRSVGTELLLEC